MKPGLTLAMIVRDDSVGLKRCLDSVEGIVDDAVVVDTGSSDDSVEVAASWGARVFEIEWPDAFDEARNYAFGQVKTAWTLWLDSDEWLLPDSGPVLREAIRNWSAFAYYLIREDMHSEGGVSEIHLLRLWRTHPSMRVQGIIHENFADEALRLGSGGRSTFFTDVRFRHDGYLGNQGEEKLRRNLNLLRRETEARPGQLYYEVKTAVTLLELGEQEGVPMIQSIADQLLVLNSKPSHPICCVALAKALISMPEADRNSDRANLLCERVWEWCGDSPSAMWELATFEYKRGRMPQSLMALGRLKEMAQTGEFSRYSGFHPQVFGRPLWENMGRVAIALGENGLARECEQMLQNLPDC